MHVRRGTCEQPNPLADPLSYTLRAEVRRGRVVRLALKDAAVVVGEQRQTLSEADWPEDLRRHVACLEIHVTALNLPTAPRDGTYDLEYVAPAS
jgi:hypothetical protein